MELFYVEILSITQEWLYFDVILEVRNSMRIHEDRITPAIARWIRFKMSSSDSSSTKVVIFRPGIRSTRHPAVWSRPPADRQIQPVSLPYTTKYMYIKSTTVYVPSSELGLSHPLCRLRVCPPPRYRGGGTLARGWGGGGVPIPTTGEKLSTLPTLCPTQNSRLFESIRLRAQEKPFRMYDLNNRWLKWRKKRHLRWKVTPETQYKQKKCQNNNFLLKTKNIKSMRISTQKTHMTTITKIVFRSIISVYGLWRRKALVSIKNAC